MSIEAKPVKNISMVDAVKEVQSTIAQLTELQDLQTNYTLRLISSLKALQAYVKESIPIDPTKLGCPHHNIKEAHLISEAQILIISEDGQVASEPLTNLKPDDILTILEESLPKINQIIAAKKQMIEERVELLEQLVKEFKMINETLNPIQGTNLTEDIIQRTISEA